MTTQKEKSLSLTEIVDRVRILESSGGKNDGCLVKGEINGYGYRQNKHEHVCYASHKEVRTHVMNWFTEKLEIMTLAEATCMYNQGIKTNKCTYWQKFQTL